MHQLSREYLANKREAERKCRSIARIQRLLDGHDAALLAGLLHDEASLADDNNQDDQQDDVDESIQDDQNDDDDDDDASDDVESDDIDDGCTEQQQQQYEAIAAALALTTPNTLVARAIAWCAKNG
jgi:hypothetical protein